MSIDLTDKFRPRSHLNYFTFSPRMSEVLWPGSSESLKVQHPESACTGFRVKTGHERAGDWGATNESRVCTVNEDAGESFWEINYKPTGFYICQYVERGMGGFLFSFVVKCEWVKDIFWGRRGEGKWVGWRVLVVCFIWTWNTHHHHHHHHHHRTTTTCHGAAWMENTMKDFIVHFDWMDFIRGGGSGRGVGRQQSREV